MTPLAWLLCALAIPVALAVDAILDAGGIARVVARPGPRRLPSSTVSAPQVATARIIPDPAKAVDGREPEDGPAAQGSDRGHASSTGPWGILESAKAELDARDEPIPPSPPPECWGGQSSTALLAHVRAAKAGAQRPAPNQTKPRTIQGM